MGLSAGAHHRRRSSMLTGTGRASQPILTERRDDTPWSHGDGGNHKREEQEPLTAEDDTDVSDVLSAAETLELDPMTSDDDQYDEETGLTSHQKRQRRRRRKQRRKLDARIADVKGQGSIREILSDRNVVKKLLINGGLILLWYLFSLSISIYNKWMFSESDIVFPFPLFTTSLHMAVQFSLSVIILWIFPSLRPQQPTGSAATSPIDVTEEPQPLMSKLFYFTRLVPCGAATSLDVGLGNMSLKFISLTFLTMCKSSALAFVLLFAFLFRLETPSTKLIIIIATMTVGVVMMVAGETAFNALGFALVIASAFFSGFRWGLTQILLLRHPATSNPFSTLFLLTPIMFLSLITIALSIEGPHEIYQGYLALASKHGNLIGSFLLIFPGVLAFCMISSEFALLKRSSVVTLSICGIFKEVVTISAAGIIFHDKLTTVNVTGLVVTISSIAAYNYMKIAGMRSEVPEDDSSSRESSPASDTDEGEHSSGDPGDYRRVAHQDSSIISPAPGGYLNDDPQSSSASDQRHSFRVRSSGARRGLSISTSIILEDDNTPPPLKSAPATITTMAEAGFPHLHAPDHEASPGVQSSSSVSPIRSQHFTQH